MWPGLLPTILQLEIRQSSLNNGHSSTNGMKLKFVTGLPMVTKTSLAPSVALNVTKMATSGGSVALRSNTPAPGSSAGAFLFYLCLFFFFFFFGPHLNYYSIHTGISRPMFKWRQSSITVPYALMLDINHVVVHRITMITFSDSIPPITALSLYYWK